MAQQLYRTLTGQSQNSDRSTPAQPQLTRTTTTDPLTGTLNHLTEAQLEKLDGFKAELEKGGWWSPSGINGKPTHDDGTLLRYLRARKFDIAGAVGQFSDTEKWYKEQHVEELYEHYDVELYEKARLLYPQWTGHRDKRGIPLYVYVIKGLDSKAVSKYSKEAEAYKKTLPNHKNLSTPAKLLPLFALYHNLLNFVLPLVSSLERPNPEIPVTNSTNIVDISGVGLSQFWNLKAHMQDASVLATAHYPETLDRIFIIGAPSFFPTVWGWVKRWFDPVTVSKIFILGKHEVKPTLEKFMDPKDFPKKYGGQLDWEWGDVPHMDAESTKAVSTDGNQGWVRGPCLWLEQQRIVVGSDNGKLRRPDKEVAEKKPVVYAADYTEEPVHADRKASVVSKGSTVVANGSPERSSQPQRRSAEIPAAASVGGVAGGVAATKAVQKPTQSQPPQQDTSAFAHENLRTAPDGSQVHLPAKQAAHPAQTAEYISPVPSRQDVSSPTPAPAAVPPAPVEQPSARPTVAASNNSSGNSSATLVQRESAPPAPHPVGQTQPGPLPAHTVALNQRIAAKMEGESLSTIPAVAGGNLPHPEIVLSSDKSLGLAMEADKLNFARDFNEKHHASGLQRPQMDRFVTAQEF